MLWSRATSNYHENHKGQTLLLPVSVVSSFMVNHKNYYITKNVILKSVMRQNKNKIIDSSWPMLGQWGSQVAIVLDCLEHRDSLWVRLVPSNMIRVILYNREKGCNRIDPSPIKSELSLNVFEVLFLFLVQWEVK